MDQDDSLTGPTGILAGLITPFPRCSPGRESFEGGDDRTNQQKDREDLAESPLVVIDLDGKFCLREPHRTPRG